MDQPKPIQISIAGPAQAGKTSLGVWLADILISHGHDVCLRDDVGNMKTLPEGVNPVSKEGQQHRRGHTVTPTERQALLHNYMDAVVSGKWPLTQIDIRISETSS